jgi:hypothetical protein
MTKRYRVTLTQEERDDLTELSSKGKLAVRTVLYARALLLLDQGEHAQNTWAVASVAEALGTTSRSLEKLKKRFVEEGLAEAIERKKRETPPREIRFDGKFEAQLLALACSAPPEGKSRWTIRLLAEKVVALQIAESVSAMTVCNTLKKMNLSLT